jgi:hypothetical protein
MAEDEYRLDDLESDLYDLALKMHEIDILEKTIDRFWAEAAIQAIPLAGPVFWGLYNEIRAQNEATIISSDSELLGSLPDRCRRIVGIDHHQFKNAQAHFEAVGLDMVDLQGAPGNALSNIGNWYGAAAEAFEAYFEGYEPSQSRQAQLIAAQINGCASLTELVVQSKAAVQSLMENSLALADQMIDAYKNALKALQVTLVVTVVAIAAAGFGFAAAGGAAAVMSTAASGAGSLVSGTYGFYQTSAQLEAQNLAALSQSVSDVLGMTEEAVSVADDEIFNDLEAIRAEWNIHQFAIPAPPGSDEVSGDTLHHESAL